MHYHPYHCILTDKGALTTDALGTSWVEKLDSNTLPYWHELLSSINVAHDYNTPISNEITIDNHKLCLLIRAGIHSKYRSYILRYITQSYYIPTLPFNELFQLVFNWPIPIPFAFPYLSGNEVTSELRYALNFRPASSPCFAASSILCLSQLPKLFSFTENGKLIYLWCLCILANRNPAISFAPTMPALLCGLLIRMKVQHAYPYAHTLLNKLFTRIDSHDLVQKKLTRQNMLCKTKIEYHSGLIVLSMLIINAAPKITKLFISKGVYIPLLLYHMHCSFFAPLLPPSVSLNVIDMYINEGDIILFRVSLAIFIEILENNTDRYTHYTAPAIYVDLLQDPPILTIDKIHDVFDIAFDITLSDAHLIKEIERVTQQSKIPGKAIGHALFAGYTYQKSSELLFSSTLCTNGYLDDSIPLALHELKQRPVVTDIHHASSNQVKNTTNHLEDFILHMPNYWEVLFDIWGNPALPFGFIYPSHIKRVYNTDKNGWSLAYLYRVMQEAQLDHPTHAKGESYVSKSNLNKSLLLLLDIKSKETTKEIVGVVIQPLPDFTNMKKKYTGNKGSFVFTLQVNTNNLFMTHQTYYTHNTEYNPKPSSTVGPTKNFYDSTNNYYISLEPSCMTIGGGSVGSSALQIHSNMRDIKTDWCQTFSSPPLFDSSATVTSMEVFIAY